MAEVVDWSPVDESNNSPPPVGAPEHHAPSATNNIMRAMMGSIRRWYDSVNTQLANFLPLTGGVVTGNTVFQGPLGIAIQGTWLDGDGAGTLIVRNVAGGDTGGAVASMGYGAAFLFSDRDMTSLAWSWYANAGNAMLGRYGAAPIVTVNWGGQVSVAGNLTATGTIAAAYVSSSGAVNAATSMGAAYIESTGAIAAAGNISAGGNVDAAGTVEGAYVHSTGDILADDAIGAYGLISAGAFYTLGGLTAGTAVVSGGLTAGTAVVSGGLTAGTLTSGSDTHVGGSFSVAGNSSLGGGMSVGAVHSLSNVTVDGSLDAAGINCSGNLGVAGSLNGNYIGANTLSVSGGTTLTDAHVIGKISAIGNDTNFYIQRNGTQRIINFEPNTYLMFDTATNNFSIVIDGVTKESW